MIDGVRRHRRGSHEHTDTSQKARRSPFSPALVARDVLTYRELPASGACRTDARLVGEVKDGVRGAWIPERSSERIPDSAGQAIARAEWFATDPRRLVSRLDLSRSGPLVRRLARVVAQCPTFPHAWLLH